MSGKGAAKKIEPRPGQGLFIHVHHQQLVEWSYGIEDRFDYIQRLKNPDEQELRVALIKQVVPEGLPQPYARIVEQIYLDNVTVNKGGLEFETRSSARVRLFKSMQELNKDQEFHKLVCHPKCAWRPDGRDIFCDGIGVDVLLGQDWKRIFRFKI